MTAAVDHDRVFASLVNATIDQLGGLLQILDEERQALAAQAPERLQAVVQRKLQALAEVERAVVARDRLQQAAGLPPGLDGGGHFVAERAPHLADHWQRLLQLCRAVDQNNAANGQLALQSARQARDALSILTGRERSPALYSPRRRAQPAALSGQSFGRV